MPLNDVLKIVNSVPEAPGLYFHIPFCGKICPFCPYNKVLYQKDLVKRYFVAFKAEISRYVEYLTGPFSSLYIGGGTPTLCLSELSEVIDTIPISGERAIEVYPHHATPDRVHQLQQLGIDYICLGIQSFNDDMLRYLERPASGGRNRRALENTVGRFDCVDADLIFDVGFSDETIFLEDLLICLEYGVEQISTYPLMRFGFTPFGKARHNSRKEHQLLRRAEELANKHGYERSSVWTFSRQDAPRYSSITRPFYLGMGAGSASYTGRYFLINHFSLERYIRAIEKGQLPIAFSRPFPRLVSSAYAAFWQAYTGRVDIDQLTRQYGKLPGIIWNMAFSLTTHLNWAKKHNSEYELTPGGLDRYHDLERWVTYHFIEPLWSHMMNEHSETELSAGHRLKHLLSFN